MSSLLHRGHALQLWRRPALSLKNDLRRRLPHDHTLCAEPFLETELFGTETSLYCSYIPPNVPDMNEERHLLPPFPLSTRGLARRSKRGCQMRILASGASGRNPVAP